MKGASLSVVHRQLLEVLIGVVQAVVNPATWVEPSSFLGASRMPAISAYSFPVPGHYLVQLRRGKGHMSGKLTAVRRVDGSLFKSSGVHKQLRTGSWAHSTATRYNCCTVFCGSNSCSHTANRVPLVGDIPVLVGHRTVRNTHKNRNLEQRTPCDSACRTAPLVQCLSSIPFANGFSR